MASQWFTIECNLQSGEYSAQDEKLCKNTQPKIETCVRKSVVSVYA